MDLTSPTHDDLVALAVTYRRQGNLVGLAALHDAVRVVDSKRYTAERADDQQWWVVDTWDAPGRIVETTPPGRPAQIRANQMNRRNIADGTRDLAEKLQRAVAGEVA